MRGRGGGVAGFTLVEVMVGLAVFAAAVGGIYAVVWTQADSTRVTNNFLQAQEQGRYGLERMVEEARWGTAVQSATGGATPSVTVSIPATNPLTPGTGYTVTYGLAAGGLLQRTMTQGTAVTTELAASVTGLTFTFYDNTLPTPNVLDIVGTPSQAPNVYRVTIGVTVAVGAQARTFTSDVFLRNKP